MIRTMPKTIHEFVARGFKQSHQFAIVLITEIDDGSLSLNVDSVADGIICMN